MKRILTIIFTLSAVNAFAFSGSAIDKIIKEKEAAYKVERIKQQEAIEAAKTPIDRLAEAEEKFFTGKIGAKTDFETKIGDTCRKYDALAKKRDHYVDLMNSVSEQIPGTETRVSTVTDTLSWGPAGSIKLNPFTMYQQGIQASEQQMDTIRRYSPVGFDLPSCSGEYPYNGGIRVGFTNGKVMDINVKSNLYLTSHKYDMNTNNFTVIYQSIDGKSDMSVVYQDKQVARIVGYSNQRFTINSATGEYIFKDKNVAVNQNDLPNYIEQLYRNCDIKNIKGLCATTEDLFVLLGYQPAYISQAIKTIGEKYIKTPTVQAVKPILDVPQL